MRLLKNALLLMLLTVLFTGAVFAGGAGESATPAPTTRGKADPVGNGVYTEAPMLQDLVLTGELPPVDERIPSNPRVVQPDIEIGNYGGTLQLVAINKTEWGDLQAGMNGAQGFFDLAPNGAIVHELVDDVEIDDDNRGFTFTLRDGIRWSDGQLFTTDDVMFAIEDKLLNQDLSPTAPSYLMANGQLAEITKVDDLTIRFEFAVPNPAFLLEMTDFAAWQQHMIEPKHYLSRWHIDYNDAAGELAAEEGFGTWTEAFDWHRNVYSGQNDLDLPRLEPFIITESSPTRKVYERNPFYYKVDTSGQQLPYLDRMEVTIVSNVAVHDLKVLNGEVDFASIRLSLQNYPVYSRSADRAEYQLYTVPGTGANVLYLNQNYSDPALRELFADVRFREAVSLAVDRAAINDAVFFGQAKPIQATVGGSAPFFRQEWAEHLISYDPDRATEILVGLGLTETNRQGIRLLPDGRPLTLVMEYFEGLVSTPEVELLKSQLEAVGIGVAIRSQPRELLSTRLDATDQVMVSYGAWQNPPAQVYVRPVGTIAFSDFARGWTDWLSGDRSQGIEPPDDVKEFYEMIDQWKSTVYGSDEWNELGIEIFDWWGDQLFVIGVVGNIPHPLVARSELGNVTIPPNPWYNHPFHAFSRARDQIFWNE
jgi:peptide/nickel transport system substrate-binding protein